MAKTTKKKGFLKNKNRKTVQEKIYELQNGKDIKILKNSVVQIQYPFAINLVPIKRAINNDSLAFGELMPPQDKKKNISDFNNSIIGLKLTKNERIVLDVLALLISNSTFQVDIKNKNVELSNVKFKFHKKIIRELSGINDIQPIISKLSNTFIFKTNNRGGKYIVDKLFNRKSEGDYYYFRFSKYLAYDFKHKSNNGYTKRRDFYKKKRNTIYETLFLELIFTKTAVFKNKKPVQKFQINIKQFLQQINLYNLMHENKKKAVWLLNSFIKASFELGVFTGDIPVFDITTLDRNSKSNIVFTVNPDFDWTKCDWDKWNIEKYKEIKNGES